MASVETADFLVEIGTEELPPKSLRELELAFGAGIASRLADTGLGGQGLRSYATPRRLAVLAPGIRREQASQKIEKRGPPLKVAFDAAGRPTRAAIAFAEGCGTTVEALERIESPNGAWLVYRGESAGQRAAELLPAIVGEALAELPVARRMRWGARDFEFVRPVHWLLMMLGKDVVSCEILGLMAGRTTRGHRFLSGGPLELLAPADYVPLLRGAGCVLADFEERRECIRGIALDAGRELGGETVIEPDVLDEVTALVEWPVAVTGRFDPAYLRLPEDVLIATLQGHQRYFPVRGGGGDLLPHFVTISNLPSREPEQVRRGNERVVRPRLSDAAFFWEQDLRTPLAARVPALAGIVFQKGLGTLADKSRRVATLGQLLAAGLGADAAAVERAAMLAKTDLLTDLVKEFPELQGRMGRHYALANGEPEAVALAIEEQYLPRHAGDRLAGSAVGQCLALADRLDTLAGIFALGKRPSGNKDPFALRRAALGIVRTLIEGQLDLELPQLLATAVGSQPPKVADHAALAAELGNFIIDRLRAWYLDGQCPGLPEAAITAEMFEAVRARAPASPLDFHARLLAVRAFAHMPEAQSLAVANKRIANILKGITESLPVYPDPALFDAEQEARLQDALVRILPLHRSSLASRDYAGALARLATLREPVDAFFDAVMVMTDDAAKRRNRLALLGRLRALFLDVADLSGLTA